jgi:hypothetical protein
MSPLRRYLLLVAIVAVPAVDARLAADRGISSRGLKANGALPMRRAAARHEFAGQRRVPGAANGTLAERLAGSCASYTVKSGDSLDSVATAQNLSLAVIMQDNGLTTSGSLSPGSTLRACTAHHAGECRARDSDHPT